MPDEPQVTHYESPEEGIRDSNNQLEFQVDNAGRALADILKQFEQRIDLTADERAFIAHLKGAEERLRRASYVLRDVRVGGGVYFDTPADRQAFNLKTKRPL